MCMLCIFNSGVLPACSEGSPPRISEVHPGRGILIGPGFCLPALRGRPQGSVRFTPSAIFEMLFGPGFCLPALRGLPQGSVRFTPFAIFEMLFGSGFCLPALRGLPQGSVRFTPCAHSDVACLVCAGFAYLCRSAAFDTCLCLTTFSVTYPSCGCWGWPTLAAAFNFLHNFSYHR